MKLTKLYMVKTIGGEKIGCLDEILAAHRRWAEGEGGQRADLRLADLCGADLERADLRWANLRGADLREAILRWTDLREADLCWADLHWANLDGANLDGASLERASLEGANLEGADLDGARLNWSSHALIAEILRREADTTERREFVRFVAANTDLCWESKALREAFAMPVGEDEDGNEIPAAEWAMGVFENWVYPSDGLPDLMCAKEK